MVAGCIYGRSNAALYLPCLDLESTTTTTFGVMICCLARMLPGQMPNIHTKIPEPQTHTHIFSPRECNGSSALHSLLLLLSGDIDQNPGPTYPCPACKRPYSRRRGAIQCGGCKQWYCFKTSCSGLRYSKNIPQVWQCLSCLTSPTQNISRVPDPSPTHDLNPGRGACGPAVTYYHILHFVKN